MTKHRSTIVQSTIALSGPKPDLHICKIGIVSRNYQLQFPNRRRDFSHSFPCVLKRLDDKGCDTVLFSSFSIIPRNDYNCRAALNDLMNIRTILLEEFQDGATRKADRYVVYYRSASSWDEYEFCQSFGTITGMHQDKLVHFVKHEVPKRIMGNCCVLLCGETNGVKYSKEDKKIHDTFGLRKAIPDQANVILNPIHDRMTRFEMELKRKFLSEKHRWVISVWNKGKQDKNGKTKDGDGPPWTVFHDGKEIDPPKIQNENGVEIGVLNVRRA